MGLGCGAWHSFMDGHFSDRLLTPSCSDTILQFTGHAPAPGLHSKICIETDFSSNFSTHQEKTSISQKVTFL
jgi:hypothetical protein